MDEHLKILYPKKLTRLNLKSVKRIIKIIIGFTIVLAGLAFLVLPGPGILIIIFGLVILAAEYIWARKLLEMIKGRFRKLKVWK